MQKEKLIYQKLLTDNYKRTDKMFAWLMVMQFIAGILVSLFISPYTWQGIEKEIHIHVWAAIILGGIISVFPVYLAYFNSGEASTRHFIAGSQMLYSALLIHLTGGRIETHFHVFGSLAFLAFYKDWCILVTASMVVYVDHFLRGAYWPQSVYGVLYASPLRALEHGFWVLFEVVFLIISIKNNLKDMKDIAFRQANLEHINEEIDNKITERTHELSQKTTELERSNKELEQYGFIVSHDLQEPLRTISSFLQLIQRKQAGSLDQETHKFINLAVNASGRMKDLILNLLEYSRLTKENDGPQTPTNVNELVTVVTNNLQQSINDSGATIIKDKFPVISVNPTQIEQLFQNLISNSIKFRSDQPPVIEITSTRVRDHYLFSVKDNGVGFKQEYGKKIFEIFKRLYGNDTYPGTGIGLAICKKIVENHHGEIWVKSEEGKGTTFYFTLQDSN